MDRRRFGAGMAAAAGFAVLPRRVSANGKARVVVIGGGPGGATVAGELARSGAKLDVTLVELQTHYTSCFFSNHYIAGLRSFASITHSYDGLGRLGVRVVHQRADAIDTAKKLVRLEGGTQLPYDRLVVAPGIDFKYDAIAGYSAEVAEIMPHAWKGGWQSRLLRKKLEALPDGGLVVVAPPRNPYRCPPGPYERATVIANYLKSHKPKSKLIIVDPKMSFSKQAVFEEAFRTYYRDIVELHLTNDIDDMSLARVDPASGLVETKSGLKLTAALANIIPDQRAGNIAVLSGLTEGDWCPVHLDTFKSSKALDVYIVGDAAVAAEMPKSAFSSNNQAKVVAADILAALAGKAHDPPRFRNTCWSMLAPGDSVKIGADYAPGIIGGKPALVPSDSFISQTGETAALRKENYEASLAWYATLTAELFAK